ncbi:hypothetical protein ACRQ5Q_27505 [Bradyrhizobium sp. PMVTL-01]|uniref:hypothetical protein n=1 Tax=Bradyrhizobium sp. PMVTL-01 TaxID=3434999 RepID=UPI003F728B41
MNTLSSRWRVHQTNIRRYENMLKTQLSDQERQFVETRLAEERIAISVLEFLDTPANSSRNEQPLAR